jgi:hypothetical protein
VKLLVKMMVVFATLYAVASLLRRGRIGWPFAFFGTALITVLGTFGDRILMPKMSRLNAVLTDIPLIGLCLVAAQKLTGDDKGRIDWPYVGIVSSVLGGFEGLYHEWVHDRGDSRALAEQDPEGRILH